MNECPIIIIIIIIFFTIGRCYYGLMEFSGVDKGGRSKIGVWKIQEWTHRHDMARVHNAGVDNSAPCCRDGICSYEAISIYTDFSG